MPPNPHRFVKMDTAELIKKVRKIEIKAKGLSGQLFSGEYHSAFKGRGMSFSEVREYQFGDDVRNIDWNVTARFGHPFVKVYEEERELSVMLLVDVSGSGNFGSHSALKKEIIIEICAVLAFSVMSNNDKVGLILFSDKIEKFIPPRKGKSHILRIIRDLIETTPQSRQTDIHQALVYFRNVIKKRCTAFVISDFMNTGFEDALKITARKHDLVALRVFDPRENELPDVGLMKLTDEESGKSIWVDTSDTRLRNQYKAKALKQFDDTRNAFLKAGVDFANISTTESYVRHLMNLFKKREGK